MWKKFPKFLGAVTKKTRKSPWFCAEHFSGVWGVGVVGEDLGTLVLQLLFLVKEPGFNRMRGKWFVFFFLASLFLSLFSRTMVQWKMDEHEALKEELLVSDMVIPLWILILLEFLDGSCPCLVYWQVYVRIEATSIDNNVPCQEYPLVFTSKSTLLCIDYLEPQTTINKWMFQLDDSKSLYRKCLEITKYQWKKNGWLWGSRYVWRYA